jgi:DNA-directed RNA polymerase subunit RPC12/RpoP
MVKMIYRCRDCLHEWVLGQSDPGTDNPCPTCGGEDVVLVGTERA